MQREIKYFQAIAYHQSKDWYKKKRTVAKTGY